MVDSCGNGSTSLSKQSGNTRPKCHTQPRKAVSKPQRFSRLIQADSFISSPENLESCLSTLNPACLTRLSSTDLGKSVQVDVVPKVASLKSIEYDQAKLVAWQAALQNFEQVHLQQDAWALAFAFKDLLSKGIDAVELVKHDEAIEQAKDAVVTSQAKLISYQNTHYPCHLNPGHADREGSHFANEKYLAFQKHKNLLVLSEGMLRAVKDRKHVAIMEFEQKALAAMKQALSLPVGFKGDSEVPSVVYELIGRVYENVKESKYATRLYAKAANQLGAETVSEDMAGSLVDRPRLQLAQLRLLSPKELFARAKELWKIHDTLQQIEPQAREFEQKVNEVQEIQNRINAIHEQVSLAGEHGILANVAGLLWHRETIDKFMQRQDVMSPQEYTSFSSKTKLADRLDPGSVAEVRQLQSATWGLLFKAAAFGNEAPNASDFKLLGAQLLKTMRARTGKTDLSKPEIVSHLASLAKLAYFITAKDSIIEQAYLNGSQENASQFLKDLQQMAKQAKKLARSFLSGKPNSAVDNLYAQVLYAVEYEGRNSIHKYTDAITQGLAVVADEYGHTKTIQKKLAAIKKLNPKFFDEVGNVKTQFDFSTRDESLVVASREVSRVAMSGGFWRRMLLPLGTGASGAAFGCSVGAVTPLPLATPVGCIIGGVSGSYGGAKLNETYSQTIYAEAIEQAKRAGFSRVSEAEQIIWDERAHDAVVSESMWGALNGLYFGPRVLLGAKRFSTWGAAQAMRAGKLALQGAKRLPGVAGQAVDDVTGRLASMLDRAGARLFPQVGGDLAVSGAEAGLSLFRDYRWMPWPGGSGAPPPIPPPQPWLHRAMDWLSHESGLAWNFLRKEWAPSMLESAKDSLIWGAPNQKETMRILWLEKGRRAIRVKQADGSFAFKFVSREATFASKALAKAYRGFIGASSPAWFAGGTYYAAQDYAENGKLSVGAGIALAMGPMSAVQKLVFGVRRSGSRVAIVFGLAGEGMGMAQQGISAHRTDGARYAWETFWAGPMRALANVVVQGGVRTRNSLTGLLTTPAYQLSRAPVVGEFLKQSVLISIENPSKEGVYWNWKSPDGSKSYKYHTWRGRSRMFFMLMTPLVPITIAHAEAQSSDPTATYAIRSVDYGLGLWTFPIKARLGMDTAVAEAVTRSISLLFRYPTQETWKKYARRDVSGVQQAFVEDYDPDAELDFGLQSRLHRATAELSPFSYVAGSSNSWYQTPDVISHAYDKFFMSLLLGGKNSNYEENITYPGHESESLDIGTGAENYIKFVEQKIALSVINKSEYPDWLDRQVLEDVEILRAFIDSSDEFLGERKKSGYTACRAKLVRAAKVLLSEKAGSIKSIKARYRTSKDGILKRRAENQ